MAADLMHIAQITDCHIVEPGERFAGRVDTAASLRAAIEHIEAMSPVADVVIATGDLVNDGTPAQYDHLMTLLDRLTVPLVVVPGNHDDRAELRSRFPDLPGEHEHGGRLDQVVEDFPVRLIGLDTTVPGEHGGRISGDQMRWLDDRLTDGADRPTLVFQHHPPFVTGIDWMDDVGLEGADLEAETVGRHRQVLGVVCGHVHRSIATAFGGTVASCWPSTGAQVGLALDGARYRYVDEAPAVAVHRWQPATGLVSHLSPIGTFESWYPDWALDQLAGPVTGV